MITSQVNSEKNRNLVPGIIELGRICIRKPRRPSSLLNRPDDKQVCSQPWKKCYHGQIRDEGHPLRFFSNQQLIISQILPLGISSFAPKPATTASLRLAPGLLKILSI